MWFFDTEKGLVCNALIFVFAIIYFYFMSDFMVENSLWVLPIVFFILFFFVNDFNIKENIFVENMKTKDRKKIRLSSYH